MEYYNVLVEGKGYTAKLDGKFLRVGFFTTLGVAVQNGSEFRTAMEHALTLVLKDQMLYAHDNGIFRSFCVIAEIQGPCVQERAYGGLSLFREHQMHRFVGLIQRTYLSIFSPRKLIQLSL